LPSFAESLMAVMFMLAAIGLARDVSAGEVYVKAGLGYDLDPQYTMQVWAQPNAVMWAPRRFFVPGPLDDLTLGISGKYLFLEAHHLSAIEDGLAGHGVSWVSAGVKLDLWKF